jgi:hypothetical protein
MGLVYRKLYYEGLGAAGTHVSQMLLSSIVLFHFGRVLTSDVPLNDVL